MLGSLTEDILAMIKYKYLYDSRTLTLLSNKMIHRTLGEVHKAPQLSSVHATDRGRPSLAEAGLSGTAVAAALYVQPGQLVIAQ